MGELAIVLRNPPGDNGSAELGILGPLTQATTPVLRDYLRRLLDTTTGVPCIMLDMSCALTWTVSSPWPSPSTRHDYVTETCA